MKKTIQIFAGVIVLVVLVIAANSVYIVKEDEVAVIQRFSRITSVVVAPEDEEEVLNNLTINGNVSIKVDNEKGLHFKAPFIETVEKYTSKYLTYTSNEETVNTKDGRRIQIQMYAQYRIIDPVVYKKAVGSLTKANKTMDDLVYKTVINSANTLEFNEFFYQNKLEDLLLSRQESLNNQLTAGYGLYVSDVGINRKSFPNSNIANIEEKMAKEIEKDSEKLIAEGDSEYLQAQALTDRQKAEIVSEAVEQAAVIKAKADAEAISIYQESLQKDLDFYQFIKRMDIYKNVSGKTVFLDGENALFNLLDGYTVPDNLPDPSTIFKDEPETQTDTTETTPEEQTDNEEETNNN